MPSEPSVPALVAHEGPNLVRPDQTPPRAGEEVRSSRYGGDAGVNVAAMDGSWWSVSRWSVLVLVAMLLLAYGPPMMDWFGLMILVALGWAIFHGVRTAERAMEPWRMREAESTTPLPPPPRPD